MRRAAIIIVLALSLPTAGCGRDTVEDAPPPELPALLQQAWERTERDEGAAAAAARFAPLEQRNAELRAAIRSRELPRVRAAQEALRAEQVRMIATSLGDDGARQVLDAVTALVIRLEQQIDAADADDENVARLRAMLQDARRSHAEASAALTRGEHELALELALRAVDAVTTARVGARRL